MKSINLDITKAAQFLKPGTVAAYEPQVAAAQEALEAGTCAGNDFLGWLHLPSSITPDFLDEVQATANTLRAKCEVVVVAGIGGSYLGHAPLSKPSETPLHGLSMTARIQPFCLPATTSEKTICLNLPNI